MDYTGFLNSWPADGKVRGGWASIKKIFCCLRTALKMCYIYLKTVNLILNKDQPFNGIWPLYIYMYIVN